MINLISLVPQASAESWIERRGVAPDRRPVTASTGNDGFFNAQQMIGEDGTNGMALRASPRRAPDGQIEIHFPFITVPPNAVFRAKFGYLRTPQTYKPVDGVDYEIAACYRVGATTRRAVLRYGRKEYTGSMIDLKVDLSTVAAATSGGQVSLVLRLGAREHSDRDTLLWIDPRIESGTPDPFQFELRLEHFRIITRNEATDEPSVFLRGAWFDATGLRMNALADATATLLRPPRIDLQGSVLPDNRRVHQFAWRPVPATPGRLGPAEAAAWSRFALVVLFTERDSTSPQERGRAEQLADHCLRLRLRDELLRLILGATKSLTQQASPGAFAQVAQMLRVWVLEESMRGYGFTVSRGNDDDLVGTAAFEASLLDLLLAGPDGTLVQFHHQNTGQGRYEMTGRLRLL
jgi:hypothetical protein